MIIAPHHLQSTLPKKAARLEKLTFAITVTNTPQPNSSLNTTPWSEPLPPPAMTNDWGGGGATAWFRPPQAVWRGAGGHRPAFAHGRRAPGPRPYRREMTGNRVYGLIPPTFAWNSHHMGLGPKAPWREWGGGDGM